MLTQFKARARKAMGWSPVWAHLLRTSKAPITVNFQAIGSRQMESATIDASYLAAKNEFGTWDVKISTAVHDSTMTRNTINVNYMEGVSLEEAVEFLLEKEKELAIRKNAIQKDGSDFAAYCERRGKFAADDHVTNAALRLMTTGAQLKSLKPAPQPPAPQPRQGVTAGGLARMRKARTP